MQEEQEEEQEEQEEVVVVDSRCSRQERVLRLVEMLSNAASESKWDRCQAEISSAQLQSQSQQFRSRLVPAELKRTKNWETTQFGAAGWTGFVKVPKCPIDKVKKLKMCSTAVR